MHTLWRFLVYLYRIKEIQINIEYIVVAVILLTTILLFAMFAYRTYFLKILKEKNKKHELEIEHQKKMLAEGIKIQEEERERIAKQLHDDVGNKLNILSVWIQNEDTWNKEESRQVISSQIPQLISTTRTISHTLYPANIERFGLDVALEELAASMSASMPIQLVVIPTYSKKATSIEVQLYRVIQEFISNSIKHAEANKMLIHVRAGSSKICLILADNGKGFDASSQSKGMGIRNMESRLNNLNAVFKWKNKSNRGSKLVMVVPLAEIIP